MVVFQRYPFEKEASETLRYLLNVLVPSEQYAEIVIGAKLLDKLLLEFGLLTRIDEKIVQIFQIKGRLADNKQIKPSVVNIFINHGWGTKRCPGPRIEKDKNLQRSWRRFKREVDYVVCYSEFDSTYFMKHPLLDDIPEPMFLPLGHPRNDFLVHYSTDLGFAKALRQRLGLPLEHKVVLFAPTFREYYPGYSDDEKIAKLYLSELESCEKFFRQRKFLILYKPHTITLNNVKLKASLETVRIVNKGDVRDPRILMLASDLLITDYSSIFVDYLLLERPIVFYQPDLERYQETRGFVLDPSSPVQMPGPRIIKLKELLELNDEDFRRFDLKTSQKFFHKFVDDKSTLRLALLVASLFDESISLDKLGVTDLTKSTDS